MYEMLGSFSLRDLHIGWSFCSSHYHYNRVITDDGSVTIQAYTKFACPRFLVISPSPTKSIGVVDPSAFPKFEIFIRLRPFPFQFFFYIHAILYLRFKRKVGSFLLQKSNLAHKSIAIFHPLSFWNKYTCSNIKWLDSAVLFKPPSMQQMNDNQWNECHTFRKTREWRRAMDEEDRPQTNPSNSS